VKILLAAMLLAGAAVAQAQPLTVRVGETWLFNVKDGQPANARKTAATAKPAKGELMVSVRSLFGTNMIMTNNSRDAYRFRAELLSGGKATTARTCSLPAKVEPILEQWTQKADAVRISDFQATGAEGRC
jgi:hypothetical protein